MRKYILISMILLLVGVNLSAQTQSVTVSPKMKIIPIAGANLDMHYTADLQRLSVIATFDVPKASIDGNAYNGFFLNKNARIESIHVGNVRSAIFFINGANETNFEPVLSMPQLLSEDSKAKFHGFYLNGFDEYPETVKIVLKYNLTLPEFMPNELGKPCTGLPADNYWYPHNLSSSTMVELKVMTTKYFSVIFGNNFSTYTDEKFSRTHKAMFIDTPESPVNIRFMKN